MHLVLHCVPRTTRRRLWVGIIVIVVVHDSRFILAIKIGTPRATSRRKSTFIGHDRNRRSVVRISAVSEMGTRNSRMRRKMDSVPTVRIRRRDSRSSRSRNRGTLENGSGLRIVHKTVVHCRRAGGGPRVFTKRLRS